MISDSNLFLDGWHRYDFFFFLRYDRLTGMSSHYRRPMAMGSHSEQKNPLSLCLNVKEKIESGTDLQATQSCVGLKEREALSLLNVKIGSFFPAMTLSHKYSTSTTSSSSSSPSYTQQLFKRSTRGGIQYRCKHPKTCT